MNNNFIDARKFTFAPFPHPLYSEDNGDSGALELATSKTNPNEQYIIKKGNEYPELACNEFLYHKVATALGLYTQDVKIVNGDKNYRRSAAIRYVPNARLFSLKESNVENRRSFFAFEALYVILNEDDSHEYYLDDNGRMFKLDNASSFTVQHTTIMKFDGNPVGEFFFPDINVPLNAVGYDWYGLKHEEFTKVHGQDAVDVYVSTIRKFADLDETIFDEAYEALEKHYPKTLSHYYDMCIQIRKEVCRQFLDEISEDGQ